MNCSTCGHENRDSAKFCHECAASLMRVCSSCAAELQPDAKFCDQCATPVDAAPSHGPGRDPIAYTPKHLAERILAEQAAMEARGSTEGERKTITALFADLKGSTALIEGRDPEEARAILDPALQLMMDAVHRYDGYVAQALGDGIYALFGAPLAQEDHAQRALYAALRMQEELRQYSDQSRLKGGVPLQMRIGINTGEVVVRSIRKNDLHTDYAPVGHSIHLAARMEQIATPGSIVISEHTRKLTEGNFDLKALGAAEIKGVEDPLNVYEVVGAGPLRTRLQLSAQRGLSRFVGRRSELDQMQQALEQAKTGHGQIVGVMGEPGLGKSRLFYEFKLASQPGCLVLDAHSVSHGKATPYLPLIELLKDYFQIKLEDDERSRRAKVMGQVLSLGRSLEDTLPYFFAVLGIPDPTTSLDRMDPQIRRQRTFDALKRLFLRESLSQPVMVIFEDLHWIDGETQGFLDTLGESIASASIALVVNYRPEYRHSWGGKTYYTQLRLAPLGEQEADELLTFLMGGDPSLKRLKALILERTDGTPFFMEEVVQTLVEEEVLLGERGQCRIEQIPDELHISPNVQGVLAARIDRLEPKEKALLQQLAVIGRAFPLGLVKRVVSQSEDELHRLLSFLQAKEFLNEQPALAEVEYIFKHALTQEVAYGTVLHEQRKTLHEKTAQALEALRYTNLEDHYAELAYHYSKGGNSEKAVEYLHLGGQQAAQRSAYGEAITHLTWALELLNTLDGTPERARRELSIQTTLGTAQMITKGYAAPEAGLAYARADELCRKVRRRPDLDVLLGLWMFHLGKSDVSTAREMAERIARLAQEENKSSAVLKAHLALSHALFFQGELLAAYEQMEQYMALLGAAEPNESTVLVGGVDGRVRVQGYTAWSLWLLGYPEKAASTTAALARTRDDADPFTSLWASVIVAAVRVWRGELQAARELTESVIAQAQELGSLMIQAEGTILRSAVTAGFEPDQTHVQEATKAVATLRASAMQGWLPYYLALVAGVQHNAGHVEVALRVSDEAIEFCSSHGEKWYEAELHRLKGEITLHQGREDSAVAVEREAETCFARALEIAKEQNAKSWELRASASLARLWRRQGKRSEARQLLDGVYGWFTEGFDTQDLKDAKALLNELS